MPTVRQTRPPTMEARALALMNACIGACNDVAVLIAIDEHLPSLPTPLAEETVETLAELLAAAAQTMSDLSLDAECRWARAAMGVDHASQIALMAVTRDWATP